jgi:5-formyltetrahydrofolate cyclo-ligase
VAGVDPVLARKQAVREQAWEALKESGDERFPGAWGRIPNFAGAEQAAARLASLPEWKEAAVVKANPDSPQLPVRARALAVGKLLHMAVLLTDAGLVDERTVLVTTVHQVQLVEADLPEMDHDFRVDLVVTPSMVLRTGPRRRPAGILWDHLTADKIDAIAVLRDLHGAG